MALDIGRRTRSSNLFQIEKVLQIQPEFGIGFEVSCQTQGCVRGNATPFMDDLPYPGGRHVQIKGELVDG